MKTPVAQNQDLHGNVSDHCAAALILVDVLNDLDFPGGEPLVNTAQVLGKTLAALKRRCHAEAIPEIDVNDNWQKWCSDSRAVIEQCLRPDAPGRALVEPLIPSEKDYIVLKPKHSAFFAAPLDTPLAYLRTRIIFLVGLTADACVLATVREVNVRDFKLFVPSGGVAACHKKTSKVALVLMANSFAAQTMPSRQLNLRKILSRPPRSSRRR